MNIISLLIPKDNAAYIYDNCTVRQGIEDMKNHGYTAIPVLSKDGLYVGTVSEGDFLWNMLDAEGGIEAMEDMLIADIIRPEFNPAANIYITMDELLKRAVQQSFIPVTDDRGYFIGIVTRQKIILTLMNAK
ncbi:MAG: CBS domain-containing protein [Oscillospiraceae bacterium]|nr:CBS domain-containing protein [Oscillospiraceae bacterium]